MLMNNENFNKPFELDDYYTFITALANKNVDCIKLVANNYEGTNDGISSYVKETVVRTDEIELKDLFKNLEFRI